MSAISAWVRSRRDPSASRTLVRTLLQLFPQLSSSALDLLVKLLVAPVSMVAMNVYPLMTTSVPDPLVLELQDIVYWLWGLHGFLQRSQAARSSFSFPDSGFQQHSKLHLFGLIPSKTTTGATSTPLQSCLSYRSSCRRSVRLRTWLRILLL